MKPKLLITLLLLSSSNLYSQTRGYHQQFSSLMQKNDTVSEKTLLKQWHAQSPGDAELYIAYFNYCFQKSRTEYLSLSTQKTDGQSLTLTKKGNKEVTAYINEGGVSYDSTWVSRGIRYIDTGITKYPNRLDMRFGKVYVLGLTEAYDQFTDELIKAVDYSQVNHCQWMWSDNQPQDNPVNFMLGNLQTYTVQLFNAGDNQLGNMIRLSKTILKYYPERIEALSDLGIGYMLTKQYDDALRVLSKAEQINTKDCIVLNNIAYCYKLKGDKFNAAKYYRLILENGSEDAKKKAEQALKELQ